MSRRISISKLYYATRTVGVGGQVTYGKPVQIPKFISIKTTDATSSYTFYSDGGVEEANNKLNKVEGEIELGYLDAELRKALFGNSLETGLLKRNSKDVAANVAIMYSMLRSDGEYDFRVLYNCTLSLSESEGATMEEDVESANFKLNFVASPNENGDIDAESSTDAKEGTFTDEAKFFANVPGTAAAAASAKA